MYSCLIENAVNLTQSTNKVIYNYISQMKLNSYGIISYWREGFCEE